MVGYDRGSRATREAFIATARTQGSSLNARWADNANVGLSQNYPIPAQIGRLRGNVRHFPPAPSATTCHQGSSTEYRHPTAHITPHPFPEPPMLLLLTLPTQALTIDHI